MKRFPIGRWERGAIIQNPANDQYLFLLKFHDNIGRLHQRQHNRFRENDESERSIALKFPTLPNAAKVAEEEQIFELRKPG